MMEEWDERIRRLVEEDDLRRAARARVRALRGTPWLLNLVTTGACGELVPTLWQPAAASRNVLGASREAVVDTEFAYAEQATEERLGFRPEKFVRVDTACSMATAAYYDGRRLAAKRGLSENDVMGVGLTAAVTTDRERRGLDQAIVAVRTLRGLWIVSAILAKPVNFAQDAEEHRVRQGNLADLIALNAILAVAGLDQVRLSPGQIERCVELTVDGILDPSAVHFWEDSGRPPYGAIVMPDGTMIDPASANFSPAEWILFPGSFNPVTWAHDHMASAIEEATGKRVVFQISRAHPNKPVTDQDMVARASQFRYRWPVLLLEGDGLYVEKARRFPGVEMMLGADAVLEMLQERHYGGRAGLEAALEELLRLGAGFHVNGRVCADGVFREVDRLPIPPRYAGMFHPFSRRMDVSSSERRAAGASV